MKGYTPPSHGREHCVKTLFANFSSNTALFSRIRSSRAPRFRKGTPDGIPTFICSQEVKISAGPRNGMEKNNVLLQ
jgi:hypothetical protein